MGGHTGAAQRRMLGLIALFEGEMPDAEVHRHLAELVADANRWKEAHSYFSEVRRRMLNTTDRLEALQYSFTEACLKTIYNETPTDAPFDTISPFWVVPAALDLAGELKIPLERVAAHLSASHHQGTGDA